MLKNLFLFFCLSLSTTAWAEERPPVVLISYTTLMTSSGPQLLSEILAAGGRAQIVVSPSAKPAYETWLNQSRNLKPRVTLLELPGSWANTYWVRDWTPIKSEKSFTFFDYNRAAGFAKTNARKFPFQIKNHIWPSSLWIKKYAPLVIEGGNFFKTPDGHCMTSARVLITNEPSPISRADLLAGRYPKPAFDLIQKRMKAGMDCQKVTIFPLRKNDLTQHIDMWMKPLPTGAILVADVSVVELEGARNASHVIGENGESIYQVNVEAKRYFDEQAARLESMGYEVIRVPMPIQGRYQPSFVNGLIVGKTFIAPDYDQARVYIKSKRGELFAEQKAEFEKTMSRLGFAVKWVVADEFITQGGAIHCVTREYQE